MYVHESLLEGLAGSETGVKLNNKYSSFFHLVFTHKHFLCQLHFTHYFYTTATQHLLTLEELIYFFLEQTRFNFPSS